MLTLIRTDSNHVAFRPLVAQLDAMLSVHNDAADAFYAAHNRLDLIPTVVIAELDGRFVGCGVFRPIGDGAVEIKRMYVAPECRGLSIGRAILAELEKWAIDSGYSRAVLETSRRLAAAVGLYRHCGYAEIPNYPPYEDAADSVCMGKRLGSDCV